MIDDKLRVVISGGGTGGHIFPAVSIANAIKSKHPEAEILFVGAEGRMEMTRVPEAGYEIVGLPICGFNRQNLLKNITLPYKMWKSDRMVKRVLRDFKPLVAVGVGGYASFPTLAAASTLGIPCLIQEQNSFAGKTNKMLGKDAKRICVAYEGMERFFPAEKIMLTGNPVRQSVLNSQLSKQEARKKFGLESHLDMVRENPDVQFYLQTGKYYSASIQAELDEKGRPDNLIVSDFISDMGAAYRAADLVVGRAGASSISEFCLIGMPVILVPSPNVAEDHQTKNAMALVNRQAAIHVADADAEATLLSLAVSTVRDDVKLNELTQNIKSMALPDSASIIADEVVKLALNKENK